MKTSKRIIGTILGVFLGLFGSVSLFSGCKAEDEDKKYDVTIKIASDDGGEWIFTPDIQEMHTTREYDGQEHRFYVKEYQLADHPRWVMSGLLLRAEVQMYSIGIFFIQI